MWHSVLNVKVLVEGSCNQENALGGAYSVIVKTSWTFVCSSSCVGCLLCMMLQLCGVLEVVW